MHGRATSRLADLRQYCMILGDMSNHVILFNIICRSRCGCQYMFWS